MTKQPCSIMRRVKLVDVYINIYSITIIIYIYSINIIDI